ncbi:hypothetical protein CGLAMM_10920 [Acetobacteraceae bacterium EV16G]|uniref:Uncharacterized protein n=1 Tax=Sorlinia euscelidii TaxID=3081148 RepID=A0ABU7U301_9PROT
MAPPIFVALHRGHVAQHAGAAASPREVLSADPAGAWRVADLILSALSNMFRHLKKSQTMQTSFPDRDTLS